MAVVRGEMSAWFRGGHLQAGLLQEFAGFGRGGDRGRAPVSAARRTYAKRSFGGGHAGEMVGYTACVGSCAKNVTGVIRVMGR